MNHNFSTAVIGSGISGISISKILNDKLCRVEVFEKNINIGGLIKCENINGHLFHKVGGHVFNSKNQEVLDWFWSNFDKENEFVEAIRNAKIFIGNSFVGYPIENYIYQFDSKVIENVIDDFLNISNKKIKEKNSSNFEDFLIENFGETLYQLYFKPYNAKIWNTDLSKIPLDWLEGKLPMPNLKKIIHSNFLRSPENEMVHSKFWYPKTGGSQFIIDKLSRNLTINKNFNLFSIHFSEGKLLMNNLFVFDKIVFTGNVKELVNILKIEDQELQNILLKTKELISNGTSNVLCETDPTDLSWLYLPENKYSAHRIIYTGNFSKNNNAFDSSRMSCVVEFSGKHSIDDINKELSQLPGNLRPLSHNYQEYSYVIENNDTREIIASLKSHLEKYNIYLHGRFAEWEYYNMDVCIEKSLDLSNKIVV
jgi:protoporphyrinogen oxidase